VQSDPSELKLEGVASHLETSRISIEIFCLNSGKGLFGLKLACGISGAED